MYVCQNKFSDNSNEHFLGFYSSLKDTIFANGGHLECSSKDEENYNIDHVCIYEFHF